MSHLPERKEKNCLNCGTEVYGRFCHHCGQENLEPKESFWHLIVHFFNDFTHFDGKFFTTVKNLLLKPGFLSTEYTKGRRASHLNPIRMYIFTSAIFFIIFFQVFDVGKIGLGKATESITDTATWIHAQEAMLKLADNRKDSIEVLKDIREIKADYADRYGLLKADSLEKSTKAGSSVKKRKGFNVSFDKNPYKSVKEYDSVQRSLSPAERDGWFVRKMQKKQIEINDRYGSNSNEFYKDLVNYFFHQFPKILFISLPIFALILKLLYIRRKKYYYVDHSIFSTHLYIFTFMIMLILMGLSGLKDLTGWGTFFTIVQAALWIYLLYYTYKAMRVFYRQGRAKTIVKFVLLNSLSFFVILFLFSVFFFYSVLQM